MTEISRTNRGVDGGFSKGMLIIYVAFTVVANTNQFSFLLKLIFEHRFDWQPIGSDNEHLSYCTAAAVAASVAGDSNLSKFYCLKIRAGNFKSPQQNGTLQNTLQSQIECRTSCVNNTVETIEYFELNSLFHDLIITIIKQIIMIIIHLKSE